MNVSYKSPLSFLVDKVKLSDFVMTTWNNRYRKQAPLGVATLNTSNITDHSYKLVADKCL